MSIEARPGGEPAHDEMNIEAPLWRRLAWFVGLWGASVATLTVVAYLLRFWIS